jgi:hypothetical protein
LENLDGDGDDNDDDVVTNRPRKSITAKVYASAIESLGYYEIKQHEPWFNEDCSKILGQRKQQNSKWLQDKIHTHGNNLNNLRCETSTTSRKTKMEYLKEQICELETNSKKEHLRDTYRYR